MSEPPDSDSKRRAHPASEDPSSDEAPAPSSPEAIMPVATPPSNDTEADSPAITLSALAEHLVQHDVQKHLAKLAKKLPWWGTAREDAVQRICIEALAATRRPARAAELPAWLGGIAKNVIADVQREGFQHRQRHVPLTPDEYEELPESPREEDDDPFERRAIFPWLRKEVAGDPTSAETFWMIVTKARQRMTYAEIAAHHGTTEDALKSRVKRLKEKYGPKRRRYRRELILLGILLFAFVVLACALLWSVLSPASHLRMIGPDRFETPVRPAPAPTESSVPFEPAGPTEKTPAGPGRSK